MTAPREVLLMRHAKSSWDSGVESDFERPLAPRGLRTAPRIGRWLVEQGLVPDRVVSSPAVRAAQTARLVAAEFGFDEDAIAWDERIYGASPRQLADVFADHRDAARLLVVGHNPGCEDLIHRWGGDAVRPADGKFFPTATLAHVRMDEDRPAVLSLTRPRDLER